MKKGLLFSIVLLLCSSFAGQAQVRFGVKAGINIVQPSLNSDIFNTDNFTGFQIGPTIELALPMTSFDLDASIIYSVQGLKIKGEYSGIDYSKKMKQHSIDIPVNLKYRFDLIVMDAYLFAGPYLRFNIDDNFGELKNTSAVLKETWESKSFGAGLNFGVGVELMDKVQIGIYYQLGLTNDFSGTVEFEGRKLDSGDAKSRGWAITAAYFF